MPEKNALLNNKYYRFAYFPGNSLFHRLNPLSKIFFLILLTFLTIFASSLIFLFLVTITIILLALTIGISLKMLARKLRFIFFVLFVSVILNIFFNAIPGEREIILFYLFGLEFLPIRRLAVYYAFKAMFIVLVLFTSAIIYTNTTSMKDFVYSLMKLNIPYRYCFALMVGIRYIPIIEKEAKTINLAQRARGFGLEKAKNVKKAYRLIFERLTTTLISILRKTHHTSISMENRCFGLYKERTNMIDVPLQKIDYYFIIASVIGFTFIVLYLLGLLPLPTFPSLYSIYTQIFA